MPGFVAYLVHVVAPRVVCRVVVFGNVDVQHEPPVHCEELLNFVVHCGREEVHVVWREAHHHVASAGRTCVDGLGRRYLSREQHTADDRKTAEALRDGMGDDEETLPRAAT